MLARPAKRPADRSHRPCAVRLRFRAGAVGRQVQGGGRPRQTAGPTAGQLCSSQSCEVGWGTPRSNPPTGAPTSNRWPKEFRTDERGIAVESNRPTPLWQWPVNELMAERLARQSAGYEAYDYRHDAFAPRPRAAGTLRVGANHAAAGIQTPLSGLTQSEAAPETESS